MLLVGFFFLSSGGAAWAHICFKVETITPTDSHLSIHPFIQNSIHLSRNLSVYSFINPFVHIEIYLSIHKSINPFICLFINLSIHKYSNLFLNEYIQPYHGLFINLSIYPFVHPSIHPSRQSLGHKPWSRRPSQYSLIHPSNIRSSHPEFVSFEVSTECLKVSVLKK